MSPARERAAPDRPAGAAEQGTTRGRRADPAAPRAQPRKGTVKPGAGLAGSPDAKRRASVVLEVLSGLRTPLDAASALGVSLQRYYLLEAQGLQALVKGLEPRNRGTQPSAERDLRRVQAERDRLARELLRAQALVRIAQRTVGIAPPEAARDKAASKGGKTAKRRKKPTVRARRAAERLRADAAQASTPSEPATLGA